MFISRLSVTLLGICLSVPLTAHAIDIIGHRGAAALSPENTLESYRTALSIGVDVIDIDVSLTKDGVVVASHDPFLNPDFTQSSTEQWLSRSLSISELTYQDLSVFQVGSANPDSAYHQKFPHQRSLRGIKIPTLSDIIQYAESINPKVRYQIEIKTNPLNPTESRPPSDIVPAVIQVLRDHQVTDKTEVHSFDWRNLRLLSSLAPEITASYLTHRPNNEDNWSAPLWTDGELEDALLERIAARGGKVWCPHYQTLSPELISKAHTLGLRVQPWTVDDAGSMVDLITMGVDGIITNRPDILRGVLAAYHYPLPESYGA